MSQQMTLLPVPGIRPDAVIDETGAYRYSLGRRWDEEPCRLVNWVMLNPSTADATRDDPTVRRCIKFSRGWGFGGMVVTNLYAFRSTDPADLFRPGLDPVGPLNGEYLARAAAGADLVVCAWGAWGAVGGRGRKVLEDLVALGVGPHALNLARKGEPVHPLYMPSSLTPRPIEELTP